MAHLLGDYIAAFDIFMRACLSRVRLMSNPFHKPQADAERVGCQSQLRQHDPNTSLRLSDGLHE